MEIKKAKSLLFDIIDICNQLEEEILSDTCHGIYNDVSASKHIDDVISSARELMVFVNDAPWDEMDGGEDLRNDIEIIYTQLLEEYDEF